MCLASCKHVRQCSIMMSCWRFCLLCSVYFSKTRANTSALSWLSSGMALLETLLCWRTLTVSGVCENCLHKKALNLKHLSFLLCLLITILQYSLSVIIQNVPWLIRKNSSRPILNQAKQKSPLILPGFRAVDNSEDFSGQCSVSSIVFLASDQIALVKTWLNSVYNI